MPVNPILGTRRLTQLREDHLTEFFAGWLEVDTNARAAYCDRVIAPYALSRGWARPAITDISTQASFTYGRPDLILTMADGHIVAIEHKLDAIETLAVDVQDGAQVGQLTRYLNEPAIAAVAFVRRSLKPPGDAVLSHPKYIRPLHQQHFLWRDFYPLLEWSSSRYTAWLREAFDREGFTPPHPFVGELTSEAARRNFAKYWLPVRTLAHELGWKVSAGSIVELYLDPRGARPAATVWINPTESQLLFRVTPTNATDADDFQRRLREVAATLALKDAVERRVVPRAHGKATVIDVIAPLKHVLGDSNSVHDVESRLLQFVEPLLRAVAS
jgi:hypothetical protein